MVEKPDKVFYALADNCQTCHLNLLDQVSTQIIRRQITELPELKPVVIETQQNVSDLPDIPSPQLARLD